MMAAMDLLGAPAEMHTNNEPCPQHEPYDGPIVVDLAVLDVLFGEDVGDG
ncbi:hypothetical protein JL101_035510 (plasmid) [Skermanella rosea]|nr:hypothetical protein [Skermanella rosea]UEM08107.1 hypothetical protein JL101_035510 [Skermanella rosea]